jgi:hypothetical protein
MNKPEIRTWTDYRLAVIEACRSRFAEMQGHAPELYEDGYADACTDCVTAIEKIPLPPVSPVETQG